MARIKSQKAEEQLTQEHLAIQSLSQRLLESLGLLCKAYKVAQKQEYALCTFAFASELVTLTRNFLSSTHFDTFALSVKNLIGELSRPSFFVSEVANEYFDILNGLALRCQRLFFGTTIAAEYISVFACSSKTIQEGVSGPGNAQNYCER